MIHTLSVMAIGLIAGIVVFNVHAFLRSTCHGH